LGRVCVSSGKSAKTFISSAALSHFCWQKKEDENWGSKSALFDRPARGTQFSPLNLQKCRTRFTSRKSFKTFLRRTLLNIYIQRKFQAKIGSKFTVVLCGAVAPCLVQGCQICLDNTPKWENDHEVYQIIIK
jgi:hypothetical protein